MTWTRRYLGTRAARTRLPPRPVERPDEDPADYLALAVALGGIAVLIALAAGLYIWGTR